MEAESTFTSTECLASGCILYTPEDKDALHYLEGYSYSYDGGFSLRSANLCKMLCPDIIKEFRNLSKVSKRLEKYGNTVALENDWTPEFYRALLDADSEARRSFCRGYVDKNGIYKQQQDYGNGWSLLLPFMPKNVQHLFASFGIPFRLVNPLEPEKKNDENMKTLIDPSSISSSNTSTTIGTSSLLAPSSEDFQVYGANCFELLSILFGEPGKVYRISNTFPQTILTEVCGLNNEIESSSSSAKTIISIEQQFPEIQICLTDPAAVIPSKVRATDIGWDLTIIKIDKVNPITGVVRYDTGITLVPPHGWYAKVVPRSGFSDLGYVMTNSEGIIDRSYIGTLKVPLLKVTPNRDAPNIQLPYKGFQIILEPHVFTLLKEIKPHQIVNTQRSSGGFGSTDVQKKNNDYNTASSSSAQCLSLKIEDGEQVSTKTNADSTNPPASQLEVLSLESPSKKTKIAFDEEISANTQTAADDHSNDQRRRKLDDSLDTYSSTVDTLNTATTHSTTTDKEKITHFQ